MDHLKRATQLYKSMHFSQYILHFANKMLVGTGPTAGRSVRLGKSLCFLHWMAKRDHNDPKSGFKDIEHQQKLIEIVWTSDKVRCFRHVQLGRNPGSNPIRAGEKRKGGLCSNWMDGWMDILQDEDSLLKYSFCLHVPLMT